MIKSMRDCTVLNNGLKMPWLGFGVFQINEGKEVENSVKWALEIGYRSIDTAAVYGNERGVGKAIRASGIPREEIFLTTKLWNEDQRRKQPLKAFDESLKRLGTDYVDLYLIHWPVKGCYQESWKAMEEIYQSGRAKAVGVSNFLIHHLEDILRDGIQKADHGSYLSLEPNLAQKILMAINQTLERMAQANYQPIILCSPTIRRHLKRLLDRFLPQVVVLSHNELTTQAKIQSLGTVNL